MAQLRFKRGTRAQLDAAAAASQLRQGEPYLITDESRIAVGLSAITYEAFSIEGEGGGTGITTSDTAPASPSANDLWFNSTDGSLAVYYNDGTSSQWVTVSGAAGAEGTAGATGATGPGVPTGGSAGQLLAKSSGTDFATDWVDPQITVSATAPTSPVVNQLWLDIS